MTASYGSSDRLVLGVSLSDRWARRYQLTGMISEYPVKVGVYDWAVANGSF
jgi:hypothetical protein